MHNKKRLLITLIIGWVATVAAWAVPADPTPRLFTQADGTKLSVVKMGDEYGYQEFTTDGIPIVFNPSTGNYDYAALQAGSIVASGVAAANDNERSATVRSYVASIDIKALTSASLQAWALQKARFSSRRAPASKIRISDFPTIGRHKALVVLVEFRDVKFSTVDGDPKGYYEGLLNQEGFTYRNGAHGSARDFYHACSNGQFDPQFDVVGPITLSQNASAYGANRYFRGDDGQTYQQIDSGMPQFLVEAFTLADKLADFSQYDENHDGYVDNVYFFYAGSGEADSNDAQAIWPHAAFLEKDWGIHLSFDGLKMGHYACSNEVRGGTQYPVGIGTFVHEFGHVLGLADHYDTQYASGRTGVNQWDVMAAASYNDNQNTPPVFNAFERAELGWLSYTDITPATAGVIEVPNLLDANKGYRIVVPNTQDREYFIFENRMAKDWDRTLPGHGLLVWHVDMDSAAWTENRINVSPTHQRLDLVEADGTENAGSYLGDPFPGARNIKKFDFVDWSGANLFSFDDVRLHDSTALFLLARTGFVPATPQPVVSAVQGSRFNLTWNAVPYCDQYYVTIKKIGDAGDSTAVEGFDNRLYDAVDTFRVEGLSPLSRYHVSVYAQIGSYRSLQGVAVVNTTSIQFAETAPVATQATAVGKGTFTANWKPLDQALSYSVNLYRLGYTDSLSESCDFSLKAASLPSGWETSSTSYSKSMFGQASPSLQLKADGDYLSIEHADAKLLKLKFLYRSLSTSNVLHIEQLSGGQWEMVKSVECQSGANVVELSLDSCAQVRIRLERISGYVCIDDVTAHFTSLYTQAVAGRTGLNAGDTTAFTFAGLPAGTYGYSVRGVNADNQPSEESNRVAIALAEGGNLLGDINGDSTVNVSDVTALINSILGAQPVDDAIADINGDATVNVSDVTALINLVLAEGETAR